MTIASIVVLLISTLCGNSFGQNKQAEPTVYFRAGSSDQLVESCRSGEIITRSVGSTMPVKDLLEEFKKGGTCQGFIQAVIDYETIKTTDEKGHPAGRKFCVPAEASETQLAKILVKYGDDHPQQLHFPAVFIVMFAMKDAFPCQNGR